ncbi:adenine phosphoribosyltransferase [Thermus oshimai]|jgi:adenine phosphoribosyltransferase|uniref:PRPP-binding protein, adenine/guanine phosphoribosyltransferase n=1 Tax=Thermus oshimai JL-2 TaxID=751945 RepID=K7R3F7_THEOS|nr:PRPP-binding protein, adenine/guanine phosphoribosyltransferase [Thermus oshimai]AFV75434.1 PRPP-binding protein, adenine/guanine phosphoribosyltransferase [Thermus oshimai JL-2]
METYPISIGGVTRHVPLIEPLPGRRIPLVEFLGDPELVRAAAEALKPLVPKETEVLFTTETSPIPLTHVLAESLGLPYVVARRRRRPYMEDPIIQEVETLTLGVGEVLWLDRRFAEKLLNQRVTLVSDVVSSGETMRAMEKMVLRAGGRVVGRLAAFRQGTPGLEVAAVADLPVL